MLATILLRKPSEADSVAQLILESHAERRVFALHGELGAGKTTLIKAFCEVLDVADRTSSPSFAIVNEYRTATNEPLYHFDLYRLKAEEELDGIGFGEYLDSGSYCFIEWPELAAAQLPPDTVHVYFRVAENGTRTISLSRAEA
ncbi:MAG TPA: tRNA (adenosine(37)-N6)-threonylcarbamoyltransferase complex ATPase subunit type 1 TsaE [Flavobacteriales bacterium]|jgi:tRNA threonylcarbamoyladenosine biosynthesis protein TsaE|nr:tRNA (adenosine(37)-N6)-threonylcarbamoyltransferase complex ATPase subunit type 1 TsaE [Flavobacteriales bacterium]MBK6549704.1 tRNA (adenosine(37)-N6)-threonylcarbamoyltransferase complex ATPase subunit type 1 TsaE [Flavobacteriales bacterium]MBK7102220.1 tRNA (adenosine(37)-N6)-threonylcarbamoyltransferase complex ATPase subunit type 1 TsaE [Flavobacteriales bacterium]MBK7112959.1 tRNA (adenosine(37)-N6)-threonylcarbamoyltransferase complex ATPase subunit type 1 TsaE [Flavobacteriales bact